MTFFVICFSVAHLHVETKLFSYYQNYISSAVQRNHGGSKKKRYIEQRTNDERRRTTLTMIIARQDSFRILGLITFFLALKCINTLVTSKILQSQLIYTNWYVDIYSRHHPAFTEQKDIYYILYIFFFNSFQSSKISNFFLSPGDTETVVIKRERHLNCPQLRRPLPYIYKEICGWRYVDSLGGQFAVFL